jgi:cyd operon protein YbgT
MWYFSWILGLGLACAFAILNAMWLELYEAENPQEESHGAVPHAEK